MCKIDFMPNFKKIFIFAVLFLTFIGGNSYSEVVKKIEIKGNERISSETILIFGDVAIGKNYEISDVNLTIGFNSSTNLVANRNDSIINITKEYITENAINKWNF